MIIAHISDTHLALDTRDADRRMHDFASTIADINALDPAPDVIVHSGDIVHNGRRDEYAQALALLAKARAPVYVLPGNKDDRANLRAAFSAQGYLAPVSGFIDYAVEDYPVRLIALDTLKTGSSRGEFRPEQARRLIELIDAEPDNQSPFSRIIRHLRSQSDRTAFISRQWKACRGCAMLCNTRDASSPSSAATFIAAPQAKSDASPRVWCRASRRRCARANIRRR
jgi:3',5'-cyclic AMP phosphodiesterase CpdA